MRPRPGPVVAREGMYLADAGGTPLCLVRARNAAHAEAKLMACLAHELPGKTVDFDLERYNGEAGARRDAPAGGGAAPPGEAGRPSA